MSVIDLFIIAVGLSADAVCASAANGISSARKGQIFRGMIGAGLFALFQGIMPVIGYEAGGLAVSILSRFSGYAVALIFLCLGGKMLLDSIKGDADETIPSISLSLLLTQAIATSIDALAVGFSFQLEQVSLTQAIPIISGTTFCLCLMAFFLGKKAGERFQRRAGISGGVLLIIMGIKCFIKLWF